MAEKKQPKIYLADPLSTDISEVEGLINRTEKTKQSPLVKSILNVLDHGDKNSIERLAFEADPGQTHTYQSVYKAKARLLPDHILKRIAIQDDLVAAIVNARSNHISQFGRPQIDRWSIGFRVEPLPGVVDKLNAEQKKEFQERMKKASDKLLSCGETKGWKDQDKMTFPQFLYVTAKQAVVLGRIAVEVVHIIDDNGDRKFHSFRPIDVGTIFRASPQREAIEQLRRQARFLLEQLKNKKLVPEKFMNDEYAWVQVIEGRPVQAFTSEECVVYNFYPVADIELDQYPVTPIDTMISAVTTHINITTHNKLYFQSGRASRGMLIIKSEDVDEQIISRIRQQFNASINSVSNSWRMPVFGVTQKDDVTWQPIDSGSRDMEFQYLNDMNARVIMAAFQISPDELPGYQHLCLHPHTYVYTQQGIITIADLLGDKKEVGGFSVWTGNRFSEARAFVTGERAITKTTTSNGITLTTSPEHRFMVVDEVGNRVWRQQKELKIGDVVLVNKDPVAGFDINVPSYKGKKITRDMMEVLGWLTGDGTINVRKKGKISHSKELEFYYHQDKEAGIRERHLHFLTQFGLEPKIRNRKISQLAIERQEKLYDFKSVATERKSIVLYDTEFVEWLLSLGFKPSNENKAIPSFIHGLPVEYRTAFLKGFFSADGSKDKLDTPSIAIMADSTREATKLLLLNLGIRTRACEGTHKRTFVKNGDKFDVVSVKAPSKLIVKDKLKFYELIGFLQSYKQPNLDALRNSAQRWDKVGRGIAVKLAQEIFAIPGADKDSVRHTLLDPKYLFQNRSKIVALAKRHNVVLPSWLDDYYQEMVIKLESSDETEQMVDIEVFDDTHAFLANGVVVHNSRGTNSQALAEANNEWKIQAARDVGLRPLLSNFQDFINSCIFPLIDKNLAEIAQVRFVGLDADTPEKESVRIQQDSPIHMTYNEVLEKVEKKPIPKMLGGDFPFNPGLQAIIDKYVPVGVVLETYFGIAGASKDPQWSYVRDEYWWQMQQMMMQMQQMRAQAANPQPQPSGGGGSGGSPDSGQSDQSSSQGSSGQPSTSPNSAQGQINQQNPGQDRGQNLQSPQTDLTRSIDQGLSAFGKAEVPPSRKKLLAQQEKTIKEMMATWESESQKVLKEVLGITEQHSPTKKGN